MRYLDRYWSISVQSIPKRSVKIYDNSAKIYDNGAKCVATVQKSVITEEPIKFDVGKRECKFSQQKETNMVVEI